VADASPTARPPDLSLVMPAYNEEEIVAATIRELLLAFERAGHVLEIVAVDNGSRDRTGAILHELAAADPRVVPVRVEVNEGYGHGILQGLAQVHAPWVGMINADGQVDPHDVVKLFEVTRRVKPPAVVKVRRRFRLDGFKRKLVSIAYNGFANLLFGGLGSIDVNGNPKLLPRELLQEMKLRSKDWFIDAEILIKAKRRRVKVLEVNVFGNMREGGVSAVRATTCFEFLRNLLRARFGDGSSA
jgi:dolichol-phosphate mannosyltransferase